MFTDERIRASMAETLKTARDLPPGLRGDEITVGRIVTLSFNNRTGDRSWAGDIWRVHAHVGPYVYLRAVYPHHVARPISVTRNEHVFYDASAVVAEQPDDGKLSLIPVADVDAALSRREG